MLDADLNRRLLTESNLERDLGILVSNKLIWKNQVNPTVSKASRSFKREALKFNKKPLKKCRLLGLSNY